MHRPVHGSLTGIESYAHAVRPAQVPVVAQAGPEAVIESVYGDGEEIVFGTWVVHAALEIKAPCVGA